MVGGNQSITVPQVASAAIAALAAGGFESWLVGGFVRDSLMGRSPGDIDLATAALPHEAAACLREAGFAVYETGVKHGTITAVSDDVPIEVTTYRTDGAYSDGRHPDSVSFVRSIGEDLARRDFTMNAIAYHPQHGIFDPYHGCDDIDAGIIRAVGDPETRFREDALRILRGCRFASQLGFAIEPATFEAMLACRDLLLGVSAERVAHELTGLIMGEYVHDALMADIDVIGTVLPELLPCRDFDQCNPYHKYTVLEHIAWATHYIPAEPVLRWTALLHDIGKPPCFILGENGRGHFYGHPGVSAIMAADVMERLKMPRDLADRVILLVRNHDRKYVTTRRSIRRAVNSMGGDPEAFRQVLLMKEADALAQSDQACEKLERARQTVTLLDEMIREEPVFTVADLAIDGHDIMGLGIAQGPQIGQLLGEAFDAFMDGRVDNEHDALMAYVSGLVDAGPDTLSAN